MPTNEKPTDAKKGPKSIPVPPTPIPVPSSSQPIPLVPKQKVKKEKPPKKKKVFRIGSDLEGLYWKVSILQFFVLTISFWAVVISSYDPDVIGNFWAGFDKLKVIFAISGTLTSFSNVVLGGMIKAFNKQIDFSKDTQDKEREISDNFRRGMNVAEDDNKRKDKRIMDLESQLLNLSLKMQKIGESQLHEARILKS